MPHVKVGLQPMTPPAPLHAPRVTPQAHLQREDVVENPQEPQPHCIPRRRDEVAIPQPSATVQGVPQPHCTPPQEDEATVPQPYDALPSEEEVAIPPGPQPGAQLSPRPQRIRKPNVKYSSDDWDLGPVNHAQPVQSQDLIRDMIYFLASCLGNYRSQP